MYYSLARLSLLDVIWADLFDANNQSFQDIHHNPHYEIIIVAQGPVYLQVGEQKLTLYAGDSVLLMPWEQHRGWVASERQGKFFWAQFTCEPALKEFHSDRVSDLDIVHVQSSGIHISKGLIEEPVILPRQFSLKHHFKLLVLFEELIGTLTKPKGYFRMHATLLLGEILRFLATDFLEQTHANPVFPASYTTVRKLLNHLNNYYEADVSKETLERVTERKYEYLCQVFKKYAGITILSYVHQLRIQQAKHLLLHTSRSVQEIGESLGYSDPFYFSRLFKKYEGSSPMQFRQGLK
ncbi:MAG: transcriptional regulator, AraC family [Paenibacillus sp.]|jgi:AraC-like DNA-binding protein|nr:transcriptional regulator, AraC family [Paenibacillus sp.]